jgi:poly(3-hydroxybutyrate) depolymerase
MLAIHPRGLPFWSVLSLALVATAQDVPTIRAAADGAVDHLAVDGAGLLVLRDGVPIHRGVYGNLTGTTVLPISNASTWLAVATVLTLVDEGKLDLDLPVARYLTEFDRADKRMLTLRQCLVCTGGVAPRLNGSMRTWDRDEFAAAAADAALRDQPGAAFRFSGVGFQIAAVAAERVSGKRWHDLFAERIASPLGMVNTKFGTLHPPGGDAGTTDLPWVASGAVSTLDDYARFLQMLAGKGEFDGKRVLAATSVAAMWRDHVPTHVEVRPAGFAADDGVRYGLGTWLTTLADANEGKGVRVSNPGATGFTPWLDLDLGIAGVFATEDRVARVLPQVARIQAAVRTAVRSPAIAGAAETVALEHGGRERRYHLHVPVHATNIVGMPLLLVLHGGGGSGEQARTTTGLAEAGLRAGFVVAFADGTGPVRGKLLTWNSGGMAVYASEHDVDDVGFLRAVVADVQQRAPIDPARVFAAGHSNGGMMCHRLAREAADLFTGIAVVAGAMNFTTVEPASPIAVLLVHGTDDQHVRYDGGAPRSSVGRAGVRADASVRAAIDYYVERNGLTGYPVATQDGKVRSENYTTGKTGKTTLPVRVITLEGGGHAWPGSKVSSPLPADAAFPFDATAAIVTFFSEVTPLPPPVAAPVGR